MTRDAIYDLITKGGLLPVPVRREGEADEILHVYQGDLPGFLQAAKAIGATVVFVEEFFLEEEQFFYTIETEEGQGEDRRTVSEDVDLSTLSSDLALYRRRLDEVYCFFLEARGGAADLCFSVYQDWFDDFEDEVEQAEGLAMLARKGKGRRPL